MAGLKRLTLLVEGEGDAYAVPTLVTRLLQKHGGDVDFFTDNPMKVGNLFSLLNQGSEAAWLRFVGTAAKRRDLEAILLLIDGDCDGKVMKTSSGDKPFCAATMAEFLAVRAKEAGAGSLFSLAVVFARQEYESWLIAGIPDLTHRLRAGAEMPATNLEDAPRGAKEWLIKHRKEGYKPTRHQAELTRHLDLDILSKRMRSFARLEHAVQDLISAARTGKHILSPCRPS